MKEHFVKFYDAARQSLAGWSLAHFAFDAGLTALLTTVGAFVWTMPISIIIITCLSLLITITSGIELSRRYLNAEPQNVTGAKHLIRQLERLVPEPESGIETSFRRTLAMHTSLVAPPPRDWKVDTAAALRVIVRADITDDYEKCLTNDNPNYTAKSFLLTLAERLTLGDLRGAPAGLGA